MLKLVFSLLAVAALVSFASSAIAARTFGSNLSRPANNALDCTVNPNAIYGIGTSSGATSCTWTQFGTAYGGRGESFQVPVGKGVITKVRIKVGPTTGRMRLALMQAYSGAITGCCTTIATSRVFKPRRNRITTIRLRLKTKTSPYPHNGIYVYDYLGLSVLEPGVPMPAQNTGENSTSNPNTEVGLGCYPAQRRGDQCVPGSNGADLSGYYVLMRATWKRRR
jgi:hypothetical protein